MSRIVCILLAGTLIMRVKKIGPNTFIQKLCVSPATTSAVQLHMLHLNRMYCDLCAIFTDVLLLQKFGLFEDFSYTCFNKSCSKIRRVLLHCGKSMPVRKLLIKVFRTHLQILCNTSLSRKSLLHIMASLDRTLISQFTFFFFITLWSSFVSCKLGATANLQ